MRRTLANLAIYFALASAVGLAWTGSFAVAAITGVTAVVVGVGMSMSFSAERGDA